jgi:hypothetical protein
VIACTAGKDRTTLQESVKCMQEAHKSVGRLYHDTVDMQVGSKMAVQVEASTYAEAGGDYRSSRWLKVAFQR